MQKISIIETKRHHRILNDFGWVSGKVSFDKMDHVFSDTYKPLELLKMIGEEIYYRPIMKINNQYSDKS